MLEKSESLQFKTNCVLASFNTPFSLLTKTVDNADSKWIHLLVTSVVFFNIMILGLPFSLLTKTDIADCKWLHLLVTSVVFFNIMILGLQCLDARSVWLLVGHDGTFLEHSTRAGQSSGSSFWRGHLHQAYSKINVFNVLIVSQASQDYF